jgi:hypothetical protein
MRAHLLLAAFAAPFIAACSAVPPVLAPLDDQVVAVGGELRLTLSASTQTGSRISYSYDSDMPKARERATLSERPDGTGVFVLKPLAADVGEWAFTFVASDGAQQDEITIKIQVRSAVGEITVPRFRQPLGDGTMLDLARQTCVDLAIEVDDADSTEVRIDMEEPIINGARFLSRDKKTARWQWCPDANQKVADDRVPLRLSADDGENPPEVITFTIVLKKPAGSGCTGAGPTITHTAADAETVLGVDVVAQVSDDEGLKSPPLVFYGTENPGPSPDVAKLSQEGKLKQEEMTLTGGDARSGHYKAVLPNPVADKPVGSSAKLWYVITAVDNDDPTGDCDHFATSAVFEMAVENPGGQGQLAVCEPCTHDIQCGGAADNCVGMGTAGESFCSKSCSSDAECGSGFTCSPDVIRSVNDVKARQCVPNAGTCGAAVASCGDDAWEENDTRSVAAAGRTLVPGVHDGLVSCPSYGSFADEDWYKIEVAQESKVELALVGTRSSDIDLDLFKQDGTLVATSQGPESEEGLTKVLAAGAYLVRAKARQIITRTRVERNPYKITYVTGRACTDDAADGGAGDDTMQTARPQPALWGFPMRDNMICSGDVDLFKVQLAAGDNLIVDLLFDQTKPTENLDVHLLDATGAMLNSCEDAPATCAFLGQGLGSNESFEWIVSEDECPASLCTFYVKVVGANGSENQYDLIIDLAD